MVIIDPSGEGFTNVTSSCFMVADVWRFLGRFERAIVECEERFFDEAKTAGLLGKFRDLDQKYGEMIDRVHGRKSVWVLSLMGLQA